MIYLIELRSALAGLALLCSLLGSGNAAEKVIQADVCVYGGTSGGVAAAVQAARMGKRTILVEPGRHLGGMTAGGLSAVDIGDPRSIGGIAREYFTRLAAKFGRTLAWDRDFEKKNGPATGGAFSIEPHTAEQLFDEMVREAGAEVHFDQPLAKVEKQGTRIVGFVTEQGTTFRAKMFVDATYEGDLMAAAGVSYTVTREGNAKYDEQLNGIHYEPKFAPRTGHGLPGKNGRVPGGQGVWDRDLPLDPYVRPGEPSSGLLPLVDAGEPGVEGEPAPGVQAYCFRLCLTTAADRLPIDPPPGYDPGHYELVARFIAACQAIGDDVDLRWFSKYDPLPNDKWDFNTATFGGNLPGASWAWPEASYARRREIARQHEHYHRGLLHFLATDLRVPAKVRDEMRRFGLPRDEFTATGGWPHQIYVREARRMVSDLVMTEHHTYGRQIADKSIGLGSYGTDAHEIRRIVKDGVVTREGKVAGGRDGFGPYQIGYGAIVPKVSECENLLVTFALSASHTAFASIRMEPVLMVTSQSAATAACLAIDAGSSVQQVDYAKLRERLLSDKQVIAWNPEPKKIVEKRNAQPPATSLASIRLAQPVEPSSIDGKQFDVVVVGATPSGVACAVRTAREGCTVLLVQHNKILGGMMANGLMQWDALYGGHRAPLFTELLGRIDDHYRKQFGEDSRDRTVARYSQEHYPIGWVESHLAEREFNRLVAAESRIMLLVEHYPSAVEREGSLLKSVTLRKYGGTDVVHVRATAFADATYEGDLAALAKVPYRAGREASEEYKEPHAGKIFTNIAKGAAPKDAVEGRLNIHPYSSKQGSIDPTSPRTADRAVQAYNFRFCVSRDPANRILPPQPPNYNREEYLHYERKSIATNAGPNQKSHMNSPILPGENHDYPEGDWATRERITERHLEFGLGLVYFLQNDESVSEKKRAEYREWGLAKDEFTDNGNVPYEMYVREARRIVGRHVYTEHDNSVAPGLGRTPIHTDSIAVTDWYMDSHSCTTESRPGYHYDGKLILTEESRPGQIPYRSLLPQGVDNLVVPVCLSATHIAWGAVRLEPVWMQTGEAVGVALALAKREQTTPAALDPNLLVRTLAERRHLVSFFNDVDVADKDDVVPAVQFFGTQGFFHDYNARLDEPLREKTAAAWIFRAQSLRAEKFFADEFARLIATSESDETATITPARFAELLKMSDASSAAGNKPMTRRAALLQLWKLLEPK